MKTGRVLLPVFCAWALVGCTAYSFRGTRAKEPVSLPTDPGCVFHLTSYSFSNRVSDAINLWAVAQSSGTALDAPRLEAALIRLTPALFTSESSGIPIRISIETRVEHSDFNGLLLPLFSLGILPGRVACVHEKGIVRVCLDDENARLEQTVDIGFSSNGWDSMWTPLAAAMKDDPGEYTGESRHGAGFAKAPHLDEGCRKDQVDVFVMTVAQAVVAALGQMDRDTLRRDALLRTLKEGR